MELNVSDETTCKKLQHHSLVLNEYVSQVFISNVTKNKTTEL